MKANNGSEKCLGPSLPLVTAVLVCWNHERFVREAVLSALQQTYPNIQVIVYDNGSTDGSRRVLDELAREHSFTLIYQENIGAVRAVNKGLGLAAGKYLAAVSTDDVWLPDKIERQVRYLEDNPDVHLVCGGTQAIDEDGKEIIFPSNSHPSGEVTFKKLLRLGSIVQGPTSMYRVDTLRSLGGFDEKVRLDDYAIALRITYAGYRVVSRNELYTLYRRHSSNWTNQPLWADFRESLAPYRSDPEYRTYVRTHMRGYFRWLAGRDKAGAIRLMRQEPIAWSWEDVGIGLLKLIVPVSLQKWRRRLKGLP
jgi:alpha-1,3-rhamnosyltransferase